MTSMIIIEKYNDHNKHHDTMFEEIQLISWSRERKDKRQLPKVEEKKAAAVGRPAASQFFEEARYGIEWAQGVW